MLTKNLRVDENNPLPNIIRGKKHVREVSVSNSNEFSIGFRIPLKGPKGQLGGGEHESDPYFDIAPLLHPLIAP